MNPILLIILIIVLFGGVGYGFRGGLTGGSYMYGGGRYWANFIAAVTLVFVRWKH